VNAFDQMAKAGSIMGIAMQIPDVTLSLVDVLEGYSDNVHRALKHQGIAQMWAQAAPETRSALLLNLGWASRESVLEENEDMPSTGQMYAAELNRYAREHQGDAESFHGKGFPAMPLPGSAGALASSVGFDRDDLDISRESVLILLALVRRQQAEGSQA
jgi:hypothetical protein